MSVASLAASVERLEEVVNQPRRRTWRTTAWGWKAVVIILGVAIYLNIGWAFGGYYYENVHYVSPRTATAKVVAGGLGLFSQTEMSQDVRHSRTGDQVMLSIIWPVLISCIAVSWFIFGVWKLGAFAALVVYRLLWLIFAGGIAKTLGVG